MARFSAVLAVLMLSACARTVAVRGSVLLPAKVPVRSFPSIWVSGGGLEDEEYLQDRLATHLAEDGTREVRRVDLADLEPARKAGQIPADTVVVLVDLKTDVDEREEWGTSPFQQCTVYGCFTQYQSYTVSVPELVGEVVLTVYEGPTARVLQRESFSQGVMGEDESDNANLLMDELASQLERAVDVLRVRERVKLYRVDVPGVNEAVEKIRRGKWDEGRALLEKAKDQLGGQKKKVQARVWFDLGLARWFAPGPDGLTDAAYREARRALEQALALDRHPVHERVLARLERARKDFEAVEEQRRATAANFTLDEATPSPGPEAPPSEAPAAPPSP